MPVAPGNKDAAEDAGLGRWLGHNAWRFVVLFVGVLLPLGAFVALANEIHAMETPWRDIAVLWRMRALTSPELDALFVVVSKIGYQWGVIPLDVLVVLVLLLRRRWRRSIFAASAFIGSALLNIGAKNLFQRERPGLWESIAPESTFSFPSGHAMGSMTLAVTLVLLAWRRAGAGRCSYLRSCSCWAWGCRGCTWACITPRTSLPAGVRHWRGCWASTCCCSGAGAACVIPGTMTGRGRKTPSASGASSDGAGEGVGRGFRGQPQATGHAPRRPARSFEPAGRDVKKSGLFLSEHCSICIIVAATYAGRLQANGPGLSGIYLGARLPPLLL
jgi:Membrane-associated phospholipid phosphatase